jgi:ribosomal protein S18 acetylase RimI-like enzyme
MNEEFTLQYQENLSVEEEGILLNGLMEEAAAAKNMAKTLPKPFAFLIRDTTGQVVGGAKGITYYGSLYLDTLWISRELRYKGFGTQIMQEVEKLARSRNCAFMTVTTMDWEARGFYQKLGYVVEYERGGYENNSTMYVMCKQLP